MDVIQQSSDRAKLGVEAKPLLELVLRPGNQPFRGGGGLYHIAILVPSRLDLARSLRRLAETGTPLQGMSDHIVSEAVYLADPEGNGIEIYRDRPKEDWYRNGEMQLDTLPMDVDGVLSELAKSDDPWQGLPSNTIMGHIHLHVASLSEAVKFYTEQLGMDLLFNIGSAAFLSYDGYHHHVGINTWAGSRPRPDGTLGLEQWVLYGSEKRINDIFIDPSGNRVIYTPALETQPDV